MSASLSCWVDFFVARPVIDERIGVSRWRFCLFLLQSLLNSNILAFKSINACTSLFIASRKLLALRCPLSAFSYLMPVFIALSISSSES